MYVAYMFFVDVASFRLQTVQQVLSANTQSTLHGLHLTAHDMPRTLQLGITAVSILHAGSISSFKLEEHYLVVHDMPGVRHFGFVLVSKGLVPRPGRTNSVHLDRLPGAQICKVIGCQNRHDTT